jgi:hypothetical protein
MNPRHAAVLALVGWYLMVQSVPVVSAHAAITPPPTTANPNWCSEVPVSPAPPHFDGHYGTWAAARKRCTSAGRDIYFCGDLCMAAQDLWNMKKKGLLDKPDTFPPSTDKQQGPFPLPGGANGYILPAFPTAPRSRGALGLVVWNLMVPPFTGKGSPNVNVPLSQWTQFRNQGDFNSRADCEKSRAFDIQTAKEVVRSIPGLMDPDPRQLSLLAEKVDEDETTLADSRIFAFGAETARCMASNDPRLKGN